MKNAIIVIKNIFPPISLIFFLVLGFTAAMLSGIIEFLVLNELFSPSIGSNSENYASFITIIIVFVLEGFKLFLHYSIPAHKRIADNSISLFKSHIIVIILVLFSFVCTLIYTSNSLYKSEAITSEYNSQANNINNKYENLKAEKSDQINKKYDSLTENYKNDVEFAKDELTRLEPINNANRTSYTRHMEEKRRLESNYTTALTKYKEYLSSQELQKKEELELMLNALDIEKNNELNSINNTFSIESAGDNVYLKSFLSFILVTFTNEGGEYSRLVYYICVFLISIIISAIFEIIISYSQKYTSMSEETLINLFTTETTISDKLNILVEKIISFFTKVMILLAIFLISGVILEITFNKNCILIVSISYAISILLTTGKFQMKFGRAIEKSSSLMSSTMNLISRLENYLFPLVIETLLCIVSFAIISIFANVPFIDLVPTTVAMSIGSVSGNIILKSKQNISAS